MGRRRQSHCLLRPRRPESPELLPYELVLASMALDVWAVGVLLFAFVTEQSLIPVDKNDDITNGHYMRYIAEWTEAACAAKLASILCRGARVRAQNPRGT